MSEVTASFVKEKLKASEYNKKGKNKREVEREQHSGQDNITGEGTQDYEEKLEGPTDTTTFNIWTDVAMQHTQNVSIVNP